MPRMFFGMGALVVLAFVAMIATSPWRRERIFAYLDPWDMEHALGKGYQLTHALIAIGRGEVTGVGLGRSVEKLHWLPEAHTDFLFSVIGEEFGFVGLMVLIFAFYLADAAHDRNWPRGDYFGPRFFGPGGARVWPFGWGFRPLSIWA